MSTINLQEGIWIDVRTLEEFAAGTLQGSIHIPYEELPARIGEVTTDKDAYLRLYCRSGRRSGVAADALTQMGFTHVVNEGGYEDLLSKL